MGYFSWDIHGDLWFTMINQLEWNMRMDQNHPAIPDDWWNKDAAILALRPRVPSGCQGFGENRKNLWPLSMTAWNNWEDGKILGWENMGGWGWHHYGFTRMKPWRNDEKNGEAIRKTMIGKRGLFAKKDGGHHKDQWFVGYLTTREWGMSSNTTCACQPKIWKHGS